MNEAKQSFERINTEIMNVKEFYKEMYGEEPTQKIVEAELQHVLDFAEGYAQQKVSEKFGLGCVSGSFYSLIDRLQAHSEWKYPNRKWNNDAYYAITFQWIGKEKELEQRVLKLEEEMKLAGG